MRHFIFAVFILAAFPAIAADNMIKVINEDGTVSVFDMGPNAGAPVVDQKPVDVAPAERPNTAKEIERLRAVTEEAPALKAQAKKEEPVKEAVKQEQRKAPEKKVEKKTAKKADTKANKKTVKEARKAPPASEAIKSQPVERSVPPGHPVTKEEAMAIAIDNTSMIARGLDAYPRTLDGRLVWVVVFRTDQGERDILIDERTGAIVKAR